MIFVSDCAHVDAILLRGAHGRGHSMRMAEHQDLLHCLSGEWLEDQSTEELGDRARSSLHNFFTDTTCKGGTACVWGGGGEVC
jgi:hypothetical protein